MKSNKEILREYLDLEIMLEGALKSRDAEETEGRSTNRFDNEILMYNQSIEAYKEKYYWIKFIMKEMDGIL